MTSDRTQMTTCTPQKALVRSVRSSGSLDSVRGQEGVSLRKQSGAEPSRERGGSTDRLLRARDVADILAVSLRGVWRLTSEGVIPAPIKLGGATRWRESDLRRFLRKAADQRPADAGRSEKGQIPPGSSQKALALRPALR